MHKSIWKRGLAFGVLCSCLVLAGCTAAEGRAATLWDMIAPGKMAWTDKTHEREGREPAEEENGQGQEPEKPEETTTARIAVTGDLMVHSYQYEEAYNKETGTYDFSHNFQDVKKYFEKADLTIGNLETVFAGEEVGISDYPMFNTPDSFGDALLAAGFDVLTTANNHCMDKREAGLLRTLSVLDSLGIAHTGTFRSQEERDTILFQEVNGIKLAILSYTYGTNGIPISESYEVNLLDEELIRADIQKAKGEGADFIIVMPHMGIEYELSPRETYVNWADMMLEAGADAVLASHPHVLQPMEYKKITNPDGSTRTGFVIYSLGNFISSQTTPPRNAGVILNLDLEKTGDGRAELTQVSVIPVWTQFRGTDNKNHFVVRSVYEMLNLPEDALYALVRKKDVARLWEIHAETTKMLLGQEVPISGMQDEYIVPAPDWEDTGEENA